MRDSYIPEKVRSLVKSRAEGKCEYCKIEEADTYLSCEIDHIIGIKHGGDNNIENLAYTCFPCNRFKGSDLATINENGNLIRLFNPRKDSWEEHFGLSAGIIIGKTDVAEATIKLLRLNDESRVEERLEIEKSKKR